jgi:predicted DCC family thiol-disulfide oxidoreductase YuxK
LVYQLVLRFTGQIPPNSFDPSQALFHISTMSGSESHPILLFDGVCNLCHGAVQFIIPKDPKKRLRFASLQSTTGKTFLQKHGLDPAYIDSLVLVEPQRAYTKGKAAMRITGYLKAPWPIFSPLQYLPSFLLDPLYNWVARNRYKWFGKKEACPLPDPAQADRFLDSASNTPESTHAD